MVMTSPFFVIFDMSQCFGGHNYLPAGHGAAGGDGFIADIDHIGPSVFIEMR